MKKKLVKYEIDLENLPPLTARQKAEMEKLKATSGKEIDFSDIPRTGQQFWKNAVRGGLYKPVKASTTVRVDADVLHWLRSKGKGYQTRINAILRQAMLEEAGKHPRSA
jgi:uncharacterized protein (DUF4415 family)